ncbi:hypothetical protein EDC19_2351 [Natranaerovirga hydrolytica]|uniref:DUF4015 domain-containing protein n=1 Tax=Natranaerovirga hydrolytica TaxID=680378 RepID=A0A4R1MFR1_9FIRM|nr:putative glycoside hydrolase [Natranaerovirga hydrolytica]TCK90582.1 hypothetical protein EDC19_2351 [Natranaerovirga hydrolytica]
MGKRNNNKKNSFKILGILVIMVVVVSGVLYYNNYESDNFINLPNANSATEVNAMENNVDFSYYQQTPITGHEKFHENVKVKGIFSTAHSINNPTKLEELIDLANETEINSFVIDVKDDDGFVTYRMDNPLVQEIGSARNIIRDIEGVMDKLYDNDIFPIARIVVFKDNYLAKNVPEYAIKNKDGSLWYYKNVAWVNPYNRDSWEYILEVAKEAAKVGFKEIQFDYIRFEATSTLNNADLGPDADELSRTAVIADFLDYANEALEPYNVIVSADVFGIVYLSQHDANNLGQDYVKMSERVDVISPMVYPSHYGFGFYGTPRDKHSDWFPYEIIYGSMVNSNEAIEKIEDESKRPIVRPWLQAFTASYLRDPNYRVYRGEEIREQIQGTYDAGLEEWILWNAGTNYNHIRDGLKPAE